MAFRLKNGIFIHVPKTGGTWVTSLLSKLGLITETFPLHPHASLKDVLSHDPSLGGLPSFAFVRHPFGWYQSFWAYRETHGWDPKNLLDTCRAPTFHGFIENVLARRPGHLSARLRELTGVVTYIGRFESLRESLIRILTDLGEKFSHEAVYDHPVENASGGPVGRYTPELLERLYQAEKCAFRAFGYDRGGEVDGPGAKVLEARR